MREAFRRGLRAVVRSGVVVAVGLVLWVAAGLAGLRIAPATDASRAALWASLDPEERAAIQAGRVRFLDGREAWRLAEALGKGRPSSSGGGQGDGNFLVILNTPAVFRRPSARPGQGRRSPGWDGLSSGERALAVTQAALRLGARLVVDCTDADLARLTTAGWRSVQLAKRAGLWRMVVFDGAHHIAPLAADPEMLLVPVLSAGGELVVAHGYVRDALPLSGLRQALSAAGLEPLLFTLPRFSLPLKEVLPLGLVVRQALQRLGSGELRSREVRGGEARGGEVRGRAARGRARDTGALPGGRVAVEEVAVGRRSAALPGGLLLAGRAAGEAWLTADRPPARADAPVRTGIRAVVGVSYGTFSLFPQRSASAAEAPSRTGSTPVLELGWPVSVWDLLLRHPAALFGHPLPWTRKEGTTAGVSNSNP